MPLTFTVIYEFDRFRLDRANQRLTRDGLLISTPGKTLALLATLIENRENAMSTDKLVSKFFPKSLFGEEELVGEILALRRLLDDKSKTAPMIRTIVGKGYQFEAEVTEYIGDSSPNPFPKTALESESEHESDSEHVQAETSVPGKPKKKRSPLVAVGAAAILVAAIGLGIWYFVHTGSIGSMGSSDSRVGGDSSDSSLGGDSSGSGDTSGRHVAILPFQSLTGAVGDDRFNRSLTEAISSKLGKSSQLQVVPAASVQRYIESGASDPMTAGRELGAQIIVRGMAQRLAGHIVVKVQLISTQNGSQIWSNRFEADSNDIAGLSSKISADVESGISKAENSGQR